MGVGYLLFEAYFVKLSTTYSKSRFLLVLCERRQKLNIPTTKLTPVFCKVVHNAILAVFA